MDGEVARAGSQFGDLSCAMYVDVIANHGRAGEYDNDNDNIKSEQKQSTRLRSDDNGSRIICPPAYNNETALRGNK
jgi:hypothetical protein